MEARKMLSYVRPKIAGTFIALILLIMAAGAVFAVDQTHKSDSTTLGIKESGSAKSGGDFLAEFEASQEKPQSDNEPKWYITALSFIFKLALVLALAYGTIFALKKFTNFKAVVGASHGQIKVIEHSQLGANKSLHLVAVGSKRLLVASTANQVNLVAELDPNDVSEIEENAPSAGAPPNSGFKDQLAQFLGNKADATDSAKTVAEMLRDTSSFLQDKVREVGSFRRTFRDV